jgi:hypothetical protein
MKSPSHQILEQSKLGRQFGSLSLSHQLYRAIERKKKPSFDPNAPITLPGGGTQTNYTPPAMGSQ